jgi:hypothetical protein
MDREPRMTDASREDLEEMAACVLALAHAHDGEFGADGQGVTAMFSRCSERLKFIADTGDDTVQVIPDLSGDTDESVLEASKRLREVYEREQQRNAADPWCLVLERLLAEIDDEVARRPGIGHVPLM